MLCASTTAKQSALAATTGRQISGMASTSYGYSWRMNIPKQMIASAQASTSRVAIENFKDGRNANYTRSFSTSYSRSKPTSTSPPEPAISRPLDTPPNPITPTGRLKEGSKDAFATSSTTSSEEACQSLSPSSPAAPRTQKKQEEKSSSELDFSKAIPPEIVNKPSIGRKGSGKFRAQKAALTLTPTALERVRSLLDASGGPKLLRIGVRNKGCAGMSYHLEYVTPDQAGKFDERVKQDGVEVLIDSKALFSIIGSEMDWQEDRLSAKFVFNNPNVVEACGCGESVRFA
jgi:iron-sulfur cluster assembly 1